MPVLIEPARPDADAGRAHRTRGQFARWCAPALAVLLAACAQQSGPSGAPALPTLPESATGLTAQALVHAQRQMVATAHPLASEAALQMLREGGSAVDATIAAQMMLTLVEPQSSGIGGGAFLMHADGSQVQAWDGRETAPAAADENLLLAPDGQVVPFWTAVAGGRAVGVPGVLRMLEAAHRAHGRLPWARLFEPAIRAASEGFAVSPRLHRLLQGARAPRQDTQARAYFFDATGQPWAVGHRLRNPALAEILRRIARDGADALHRGPIAADIVARVRGHATNPGRMELADLAGYTPLRREPLCAVWRINWRVCGMPPPSSGQLAVMQILGILEQLSAPAAPLVDGRPSPTWLHDFTEAGRLAYADRALYVADPEFVEAPAGRWDSLLDAGYLRTRAAMIGPRSMGRAQAGRPDGWVSPYAPQPDRTENGTSHLSIVDAQGRAVAMTTSIEAGFGSGLMSDGGTGLPGGFLLNNELTDFSARPRDASGRPVANRVQLGKRPRSSMSPTLVFDARSGALVASLGSPLGAAIPLFVAQTLVGLYAWGLDPQAAVALPHAVTFNGPTVLEASAFPPATRQALVARGHAVHESELASGLQVIVRTPRGWAGAADPRREGRVLGD